MELKDILGADIIFDLSKLSPESIDTVTLGQFLADDDIRDRMVTRINAMASEHLLKGEVPGFEPAFAADPAFTSKRWHRGWYSSLRIRVCQNSSKGSLISVLLPGAVYLYDCYGLSCSKLILGCEAPVMPPLWLRNWLRQAERLSNRDMAELYQIFEEGSRVRQDFAYTLKLRLQEIAEERGIGLREICSYPGRRQKDATFLTGLADAVFTQTGNDFDQLTPYIGNHKMLRLIVFISILYRTSPDYLLLQDYSGFAIDANGRYYPPALRELMSLLLRADEKTAADAIAFVLAATTRDVVAGQEIWWQEDADALNARNHIMGAYTEATATMSKSQGEQQIIEDLKARAYEVLSLSSGPVSNTRLYQLIPGHFRLVRRALSSLVEEGKIVAVPGVDDHTFWQVAPKSRKSKK